MGIGGGYVAGPSLSPSPSLTQPAATRLGTTAAAATVSDPLSTTKTVHPQLDIGGLLKITTEQNGDTCIRILPVEKSKQFIQIWSDVETKQEDWRHTAGKTQMQQMRWATGHNKSRRSRKQRPRGCIFRPGLHLGFSCCTCSLTHRMAVSGQFAQLDVSDRHANGGTHDALHVFAMVSFTSASLKAASLKAASLKGCFSLANLKWKHLGLTLYADGRVKIVPDHPSGHVKFGSPQHDLIRMSGLWSHWNTNPSSTKYEEGTQFVDVDEGSKSPETA
jgi:hypothetical protein